MYDEYCCHGVTRVILYLSKFHVDLDPPHARLVRLQPAVSVWPTFVAPGRGQPVGRVAHLDGDASHLHRVSPVIVELDVRERQCRVEKSQRLRGGEALRLNVDLVQVQPTALPAPVVKDGIFLRVGTLIPRIARETVISSPTNPPLIS